MTEHDLHFVKLAVAHGKVMSLCNRKKVGCVIIHDNSPASLGFNRLAVGSREVSCEVDNVTRQDVLHAEEVAILNAHRERANLFNSVLYCAVSPCLHCAALISEVGIRKVVYAEVYRSDEGIKFLQDAGIEVVHVQGI